MRAALICISLGFSPSILVLFWKSLQNLDDKLCASSSHPCKYVLYTPWGRAWVCLLDIVPTGIEGLPLGTSWLNKTRSLSSQFKCSSPPQSSCLSPSFLYCSSKAGCNILLWPNERRVKGDGDFTESPGSVPAAVGRHRCQGVELAHD